MEFVARHATPKDVWPTVAKIWKDADASNFSKSKLTATFPGEKAEASLRAKLWRELDNNGNGYVSLAEFDSWFNTYTLRLEKAKMSKSSLYAYARPCLIRAFNLANGVAPPKSGLSDDYVTRSEFRLLMVATQAALIIYRVFDIADTSNDRRVSRDEWAAQLPVVNAELASYGYAGPPATEADFDKVDDDHGGMILLDEAVHFFLKFFVHDPALLHENEVEGC